MVPKVTNRPKTMKKTANPENVEFEGSSSSEEENDEGEESKTDSEDFDKGDDFLVAVNEASSKKRKMESEEEEDEEVDIEDEEIKTEDCQAPQKKKKKKKKPSTADMKPPTAEEMIRLRETENLFHSNLFRMQIEEMLKEVKPKKVERKQMKPWLEKFKHFLLNIDDSDEVKLDAECFSEGVKSPLPPVPKEELKVSNFLKPMSVSAVGSYNCGCCLGPLLSIDLAIVIPKKCFLKEDYLNARYHLRHTAYLSHLAKVLQSSELIDQQQGVRWSLVGGNPLCPRLLVSPVDKLNKVKVYISAVPQSNAFKLSRFAPSKNNIREFWHRQGQMEDCNTATPVYNASVIRDLVLTNNEAVRLQALENNNNLKDGIILLRVWLRQRQLDEGYGGFSGFLINMVVAALLLSRKLNSLMSSYQVVRNVWLLLSQSDWTKEGFTMCSTKQEENTPLLQEFHSHYDVVFVDITGYCNLAANVHRLTYLRVRQEAQLAVQCLDNPDMNSFQALFMTPMPFLRQFDHVVILKKNKKAIKNILKKETTVKELTNHFATEDMLLTTAVCRLLERGVGGRLDQLMYQLPPEAQWAVSEDPPSQEQSLVIGLRLNTETAYSIVEKGPPANEPQAAEFRTLWGPRCELRRFRDGTVCEAVVWLKPDAPLASRRLVVRDMVTYLLHERLGLLKHDVTYVADQLETLVVDKEFVPEGFKLGTGEEASNAVVQVWDRLAKQLRELPDLPLDVSSVLGVSPVFRGADVFPPLAGSHRPQAKTGMEGKICYLVNPEFGKPPDFVTPIEGVVQLGLSRKWPEDIEAVRRIKAAFHLHIAKTLLTQCDLQTQAFPDFVNIFKDGFVFRVRIVYPREVSLLKASTAPDGKLCYRDTPESLELEKTTLHLPKLTGALHGLQQQYPAFSVTSRLAKRWLSAQLLDSFHMPEVASELLIASLFLTPEPFCPLAQPQPMFLRFLHLLANTNWHLEPVIVNFNGDLKRDDLKEIESHFRNERSSLPPLFISTQYDRLSSVWTRDAPTLPVLARVADLARQTLAILETKFLQSAVLEECKVVFRPPLELYDALIRLKPFQCPRLIYALDYRPNEPRTLKVPRKRSKIPIVGFDPPQFYLEELRESYSDYALFFHDTYGGVTIGVLFKPSAFDKQEFKVSQVNCRKPVKEDKKQTLVLNFDAIIEDFYILGKGLVKTIELSKKYSQKL